MNVKLASVSETEPKGSKRSLMRKISNQKMFLAFLLPGILFFAVFSYLPLYGLLGAFQIYNPIDGFFGSDWVGLNNFRELFQMQKFHDVFMNTLLIGGIMLVFGFPAPIILALMINEVVGTKFKRMVQSVSYLPHFISWVIGAGLFYNMLAADGPLNELMIKLHVLKEPIYFFNEPGYFYFIAVVSSIWKEVGWGSILYLAALTAINPSLYESAEIDGAGKWKQIRYITIPGMMPMIILLFVLAVSNILNVSFEQIWTLQNAVNQEVSDILDTYVFSILLSGSSRDYSMGIAVGLFKTVIGLTLFLITNYLMKRSGYGSLI